MTRRLTNQAHAIEQLANNLRHRLPTALNHANTIAADGWPTTGNDFNVRSKNTIPDPTANAVINRTGDTTSIANLIHNLNNHITIAATRLAEALAIVDKLSPPPGTTPRCSGGAGLDGHLDWGDPTCTRIPDGRPSRHGMCDACYQRHQRWTRVPRTAPTA
jgi:hypothetical protein